MNIKNYTLLANALGYTPVAPSIGKHTYVSSWNGFPLTLTYGDPILANAANKLPVLSITLPKNKDSEAAQDTYSQKNINKVLKDTFRKGKARVFVQKNKILFVLHTNRKDDDRQIISDILQTVHTIFLEANLQANFECPACGQSNCDSMYIDLNEANQLVPLHNACKNQLLASTANDYKEEQNSASNITGILGIILGGFVGGLASVFTLSILNTHFFILYAMIPFAAFYGMKLFKGQPGIIQTILIAVWSLIMVFIVNILTLAVENPDFPIEDVLEYFFGYGFEYIIRDVAIGMFGVIIGLVPALKESMDTANNKIKKLNKSIESTLPYTSSESTL